MAAAIAVAIDDDVDTAAVNAMDGNGTVWEDVESTAAVRSKGLFLVDPFLFCPILAPLHLPIVKRRNNTRKEEERTTKFFRDLIIKRTNVIFGLLICSRIFLANLGEIKWLSTLHVEPFVCEQVKSAVPPLGLRSLSCSIVNHKSRQHGHVVVVVPND